MSTTTDSAAPTLPTAPMLLPTADRAHTARAALAAIRPHRRATAVAVALLIVGTIAGLVAPRLLGHIVNLIVGANPPSSVTVPAVALVLLALAQGGLTATGATVLASVGQSVLASVREKVVRRALRLPAEQVEESGIGDLVARVSGDVEAVGEAVADVLPSLLVAGLQIALTLIALVLLDWRYAVAALLAAPVQILALRWYLRNAVPVYAKERVAEGLRAQRLLDAMDGAATVRALRLGPVHLRQVGAASADARDVSMRAAVLQSRFFGRLNLGELIGLSAILAVGFLLVHDGASSVGAAATAALYFHQLFGPFNSLLGLFDDAQYAGASFARLVGVVELPLPPAPEHPAVPQDAAVRLAGVRYHYRPGHDVLSGIDLVVAPGERVAVVGASGAGKSTLVKLVAGIHQATDGTVEVGGADVREIPDEELRRTVTLVSQEVHVFSGTLLEDLRLARPSAAEEEIREALRTVDALPWVQDLPDGLETVVGAGGRQLTATQAQQLALARLVLADPAIVVLDEATAEAGSAGARILERAAEAALAGRTALVVAHRLTQAELADRVVVLDAGRVVESGPHRDLLAAGGRYARLWSAWSDVRATN
jgi:ATP-binding cassette subfamily C protein